MSRFNPVAFYRELRHRRVFRVAALYGVGAWGVIAACDVIFPQLTVLVADPDGAMRAVFIAAIVLAPMALVLGWLYDVTPDGIQRTASFSATAHDPDTSLHRVDRWILGVLGTLAVTVLVATTWHIVHMAPTELRASEPAGPPIPENSIAVLPFEICAGGGVDPLLATGIASEVLRHLAEIPNLKVTAKSLIVIARASAFAFADTDADPQRIASTLRVHYLLSGTVCREGDAITVQAELVDESGYLVWSHGYTQQLDATGQVTRTVAALLAEGVGARLGAVMAVPEDEPVDRLAYEQLLIGREFLNTGDTDKARAAFEAALDRKPDYAEAVYELAALEVPFYFGEKGQSAQLEKSRLLAERALAMARRDMARNPASAHAHFVVGRITFALERFNHNLSWRRSQTEDPVAKNSHLADAERHLRRAVELNPSDADAWRLLYLTVEEGGREAEALAILERGCERDPLNAPLNAHLAAMLAQFGRYDEAHDVLDRFKQLPEVPDAIWGSLFLVAQLQGRHDLHAENIIAMLEQEDYANRVREDRGVWGAVYWLGITTYQRGLKEASILREQGDALKQRLSGLPAPDWWKDGWLRPEERRLVLYQRASRMTDEEILDVSLDYCVTLIRALGDHGEYERAIPLMEAVAHARSPAALRADDPSLNMNLAIMYLETGRKDEAAVALKELAQTLEAKVSDGARNGATLYYLAVAQALQERVDDAIATMELSVASGSGLLLPCWIGNDWSRVLDPYASLRADPRFRKLWAQCESEEARQSERIRELLAERDLDKLLAPLMELAERTKKKRQEEATKSAGG